MIEKRMRIRLDKEINKIEDAKEKTKSAKDVTENNVKEIMVSPKSKGDKKKQRRPRYEDRS